MKILGLIPARSGSKGIPNKNMKILGNKPLISFTIENALKSNLLSKVFVSTEDERTINYCKSKYGLEIAFSRPEIYSQDDTPMIDVIKHTTKTFEELGEFYDAICLLQPTVPYRIETEIDDSIKSFKENKFDTLISLRKVPTKYNPDWLLKETKANLYSFINGKNNPIHNRQSLINHYYRDGSIYLFSVKNLDSNSIYGEKIGSIINDYSRYVNLDEMEDWNKAEKILNVSDSNAL